MVIAVGAKADKDFIDEIKQVAPDAIIIGDSDNPGKIIDAVRSGFEVGVRI